MIIVLLIATGVLIALYGFISAVFTFAGYFIGIWGWAQIIGSIQQFQNRGPKASFATILIWVILIGVATALVYFLLPKYLISYLVGLGIGLVNILISGKIR